MKKWLILIASIFLLILMAGGLKLFVIGEPVDDNTLGIKVQEHDHQVDIYIQMPDSAMSISNIQYHYDGTILHLTVWKVLSSPLNNDGDKCLYYEITDETEIWLGEKLIWSAE